MVILGAIYGPNQRDNNFLNCLCISLNRLGGDWNTKPSCLPDPDNPDVLNMQDVPNAAHSRKIRDICNNFNLADPFRILYPNKIDFMYAPGGNLRNRSRLDFFLASKNIFERISDCFIKRSLQIKLFDHKAIVLEYGKKKLVSSWPAINDSILRDPDIERVVKFACYECYTHNLVEENVFTSFAGFWYPAKKTFVFH